MVDKLTFILTLITAIAAFIDFLIGEKGRRRIRDRVTNWWITVAELSYHDVARQGLKTALRVIYFVFGSGVRSVRFLLTTFIGSLFLTTAILVWSISLYTGKGTQSPELWWVRGNLTTFQFFLKILISAFKFEDLHTGIYIANAIADIATLQVTIVLIKKMESAVQTKDLLRYLSIDICLAVIIFLLFFWVAKLFDMITGLSAWNLSVRLPLEIVYFLTIEFAIDIVSFFSGDHEMLSIMAPSITALCPTAFHMLVVFLLLNVKLAMPIIRPPITLILQRIAEARTGVITLLTVTISVVIKLIQMAEKAFL